MLLLYSLDNIAQEKLFVMSLRLQTTLYKKNPVQCWTHSFPVKASCENFNVTSYYAEDTMVL